MSFPRPPSPAAPCERMAYRVKEAAEVLAISRSRLYELVSAGEIQVLKDGARTLVRRSELEAYLDRLEAIASAPKPRRRRPWPKRPGASGAPVEEPLRR